MKRGSTVLIIILATIGAYCAGSWAYLFYHIIRYGSYNAVEPVEWIRNTEFAVSSGLTVFCLVVLIVVLVRVLRNK